MTDVLKQLLSIEKKLAKKHFPPLSPFWLDTFDAFLASTRRQLVARVGRRGGKSSSLCRFAVAFATAYDVRQIPNGDLGVVALISVSRDEASQRLRTIKAILDALNLEWKPIDGGIELVGRPIAFKVFSATIGGVSGFTSILVIADEVAKYRNSDGSANPADEVLASVRPTMATQPNGRIVLSSSAMGTEDAHATAFDLGETDFQVTAFAESWIANPSITEADTRKLEPDEATWAREYACIPQAGGVGALDVEALKRCVRPLVQGTTYPHACEIVIDSSGGKNDAFVISVFAWVAEPGWEVRYDEHGSQIPIVGELPPPKPRLWLAHMVAAEGEIAAKLSTSDVADEIARIARRFGASRVHGDQYGAWSWASDLGKRGLRFEEHPWSATSKTEAVLRLRQLIRDGILVIDPQIGSEADTIVREAGTFQQMILPSGAISFRGRGSSKDDRIMTLLLAARVDAEGRLRGSPLGGATGKHTIYDNDEEAADAAE